MQSYLRLGLIFFFWMIIITLAPGQNVLVEGKVIDGDSGESLPYATIVAQETPTLGTVADLEGRFSMMISPEENLEFSYVGYETRRLSVAKAQALGNIELFIDQQSVISVPVVRAKINYNEYYTPTVQRLGQAGLWSSDAINISQAFDGLPGVQIQQGALNTQRLSLRGVGARTPFATDQVRLYWNDFPLTNGAGESVLEDIETGFLRMAYVQTGPAPAALGSNLGGSIQLVSKEWDARNWGTSFGVSVGDFGRNREWINLHNRKGRWQQDLSIVRSASAGYRDNNDYERFSGTVLGRVKHSEGETIYMLHLRQMQAEIPSSLNANDLVEKPTAAAFNWASVNGREDQLTYLLGLQHTREISDLGDGWGRLVNRSSVFTGRRTNDEVRPFNIINEDSYQYGLRTVFNLRNARVIKGSLQLGAELFLESYDLATFNVLEGGAQGDLLGEQTENRFYYFAFSNWTAHWGKAWKTVVEANLRQTHYNWQAVNLDRAFVFDALLLPSFSVFYQKPGQHWRLHARYNRGISQPEPSSSIENSFLNGEPLSAASGWNRELGFALMLKNFNLNITAFQMDLEDALVQRQDNIGRVLFFNGGSTRHQGVEFQANKRWRLGEGILAVRTSYTLSDISFLNFNELDGDYSGNEVPGVHPHRWRSDLVWQADRLKVSFSADVAAKQWVDDENTTTAEGYTVLHTRVAYTFPSLGRGLNIYAGCNNLLDKDYVSMVQVNASGFGGNLPRYFYPGLPRYFYLGVDYGL